MLHNAKVHKRRLTLLWWIEAGFQAVEKLVEAQFPVSILIRELNEGINTEAPGKHVNNNYLWLF